MKGAKRAVALLLVIVLCLSTVSGCSLKRPSQPPATKLTVGYAALDGRYSPFYAESESDLDVVDMTQIRLLSTDRNGQVIMNGIKGETTEYNGTRYTYTGPADVMIIAREDGTVDYNFTLRQDITFSDGKPLTAADVLFTMYVLCDPTYDGPVDFASLPIVGLSDFRREMMPKWRLILRDTPSAAAVGSPDGFYTAAEAMTFWEIFNKAGTAFAQTIVEHGLAQGKGRTVSAVAASMGYTLPATAQAVDLFNAIVDRRGYELELIDKDQATVSFEELLITYLSESQRKGVRITEATSRIAGIKKTGTYTFCVTLEHADADALSQFTFGIAPMHYYGNSNVYNEAEDLFGFHKGDLSSVRRKNSAPIGAGPYCLTEQSAGAVNFKANAAYYRGRPKTDEIVFKKMSEAEKISALEKGEVGLAVSDFGTEALGEVERVNGGVLNGDVLSVRMVADTGLGYLCIAADGVSVGDEPYSEASRYLRSGLMTIFSYYRQISAVEYYGSLVTIPGYPFGKSGELFSNGVDGNPIPFTIDPTKPSEDTLQQAVLGFFEAAGYTVEGGKVTAAPEGADTKFKVIFAGSNVNRAPEHLMLVKAQEMLERIGIQLQIVDVSGESDVRVKARKEEAKIWCFERRAAKPSDLYAYYFSGNAIRPEGGMQYLTEISDAQLDQLLLMARAEQDEKERASLYAACTELIEKQAVELPLYYRKQAVIVRSNAIDVSSLPKDMTGHYSWIREIETVRAVG